MRELTVRIRFTSHCLGDVKDGSGTYRLPRHPDGFVTFLASWHHKNMRLAAQLLGRHQEEVQKILWDVQVDGAPRSRDHFHRLYYAAGKGRSRYTKHEAYLPGEIVSLNCVVPQTISDDDFLQLMSIAGRYKGLSPWKPGEYGHYKVESIRPRRQRRRRGQSTEEGPVHEVQQLLEQQNKDVSALTDRTTKK